MEDMEHRIVFDIWDGDFEQCFGRRPKNLAEFEDWAYYCEKGLRNGHIDWAIVFECAKDAMEMAREAEATDSAQAKR